MLLQSKGFYHTPYTALVSCRMLFICLCSICYNTLLSLLKLLPYMGLYQWLEWSTAMKQLETFINVYVYIVIFLLFDQKTFWDKFEITDFVKWDKISIHAGRSLELFGCLVNVLINQYIQLTWICFQDQWYVLLLLFMNKMCINMLVSFYCITSVPDTLYWVKLMLNLSLSPAKGGGI